MGTVVQRWISRADMKQWWCWTNSHKQWFSNGYREETWNDDDGGRTVTNSGSATGIGKRRETVIMLDEWSQIQSTLVITYGVSRKECLYLRIIQIMFWNNNGINTIQVMLVSVLLHSLTFIRRTHQILLNRQRTNAPNRRPFKCPAHSCRGLEL